MMKGGYIPWLVLLFLCSGNVAIGQRVTIRVINLNERPLKNKQVYISGLNAQAASKTDERLKLTEKPIRAELSLLTDSKGEIMFDLPNPAPAFVYVRPVFSERVWDCICFVSVPTADLLQKGFIVLSPWAARKKPQPSILPRAGEVLFVMRRLPLWFTILFPIEKG